MYVLRGLANVISNGTAVGPLPDGWKQVSYLRPLGLSIPFFLFIAFVVIGEVLMRTTVWGLEVRATGSDRKIAHDTEVRVDFVNYSCFALMGLLAAISGIFVSLRINSGMATAGMGTEFRCIVGCALGGVSIFGYEGTIIGAALGVLLSQVIATGMVAAGLPSSSQDVVLGILLVGIMALDIYKQKLKPIKKETAPRCSKE